MNWYVLLGILSIVLIGYSVSSAYADPIYDHVNSQYEVTPVSIGPNQFKIVGKDYEVIEDYNTMTGTWTSKPERIVDYYDFQNKPVYVDKRVFQDPNVIQVETQFGSVVLDKSTCAFSFFNKGYITPGQLPLFTDSIIARRATVGTDIWQPVNSVNNAACQASLNGNELTAKKQSAAGIREYKYILTGNSWKTQLEATNLSSLTDQKFGFTQTIDLNRDTIRYGGEVRNLDNFDNTTFDRTWLENNTGKVMDLLNDVNFDFDIAFDNLWAVTVYDTGANKSRLAFDFTNNAQVLLPTQKLILDPTFGYTTSTVREASLAGATGTTCSTTGDAISSSIVFGILYRASSSSTLPSCTAVAHQWDISSISGPGNTVTGANIRYDITGVSNGVNCQWNPITTAPTSYTNTPANAKLLFDDINDGLPLVSSDSQCTTVANDKIINLGSNGTTNIQSAFDVSQTWWAVGFTFQTEVRDGTQRNISPSTTELEITYTIGPIAPSNVVVKTLTTTNLNVTWSSTGPVNGFRVDRETPIGGGFTTLDWNTTTTQTFYLDLNNGTVPGTVYNYRIYSHNGSGTSNNAAVGHNFTKTDPPTSFEANAVSKSQIDLSWVAPSGTVRGYNIYHQAASTCGSATILVTNQSATTYSHTGLLEGTAHCYKVEALTGNNGGASSQVTATNSTFTTTVATVTLDEGVIGDVVQINATVAVTDANPDPTLNQLIFYVNGTAHTTLTPGTVIANGTSETFGPVWYQMTSPTDIYILKVRAVMTNNTDPIGFNSANSTQQQEYNPDYFTALDPAEGRVNYTSSRTSDQDTLNVKINRDKGGNTFQIECLMQTTAQAQFQGTSGTWYNGTSTGYFNITMPDVADTHIYTSCWNDGELFVATFYTNSSLMLLGVEIFDATYGEFLGVPVAVFFIAMVASMATQRTAPTWIVVVLAMAGIMATLGFFDISEGVWALALLAGLFGLFVGRKFF